MHCPANAPADRAILDLLCWWAFKASELSSLQSIALLETTFMCRQQTSLLLQSSTIINAYTILKLTANEKLYCA